MQLQVFTDGINDVDPQDPQSTSYGSGMVWATSVPYSEDKSIVNTWHWPANLS